MTEKTKKIFLNPCPICGSAPELRSYRCDPWGDGAGYATAYYCQCSGCEYIRTPERLDTSYSNDERTKDKAKEVWNSSVKEIREMIISNYGGSQ